MWWVTLVDATLVRYHPDVYDTILASHNEARRRWIEGTFGGLRFVRNWMGYHLDHSNFIQPGTSPGEAGTTPIGTWTWRSMAAPVLGELPARGQEWEMTRYRDYQAQLAGQADRGCLRMRGAISADGRRGQCHSELTPGHGELTPGRELPIRRIVS